MSTLLEFECRLAVGGYDVVEFDQAKAEPARPIVLTPDATDDERYLAEKWGGLLLADNGVEPEVLSMLRPRTKRTRSFDLYEIGPSAYLEFAQTPLTPDGVKSFADRYGPLMGLADIDPEPIDHFRGHIVTRWYGEMREMRSGVARWAKGTSEANISKLIRLLERRPPDDFLFDAPGITAKILLKEVPRSESTLPRICIRPSHLRDALWIQLALAIDGSESLRNCVVCKRWFTVKSGKGRSDKEHCSNACRMRKYRKGEKYRKRKGKRLT
jgi:hypothetical protein